MEPGVDVQNDSKTGVAVMLATYNGAAFLPAQLESLKKQDFGPIDVWASDDDSQDGTLDILTTAARNWGGSGRLRIVMGPSQGFAENFRSLILASEVVADYYAFCDQDDLWDASKLRVATAWLRTQDEAHPALYCSRTRVVSQDGEFVGLSPLFTKSPNFRNALVQSIAGGNTMVMNRAARDLIKLASQGGPFVSHDWWAYMVIAGAGGTVHYAATQHISYRQHGENAIGANNSARAVAKRWLSALDGRFKRWNKINLGRLAQCHTLLTSDARKTIALFERARTGPWYSRLWALHQSGVHRQTLPGQFALYIACLINKL